jgi:hypothetical protein
MSKVHTCEDMAGRPVTVRRYIGASTYAWQGTCRSFRVCDASYGGWNICLTEDDGTVQHLHIGLAGDTRTVATFTVGYHMTEWSWARDQRSYGPDSGPRGELYSAWCDGDGDDTPTWIISHGYDSTCASCYHGFSHSKALHELSTAPRGSVNWERRAGVR